MAERPLARSDFIAVQEMGEELLVFDKTRSRAHSLNGPAAAIWRACDGKRDRDALCAETGLDPTAVELALDSLRNCHLLDGYDGPRVSRRQAFKRVAVTGAAIGVALPVIRSIAAPSAALAQSLVPIGCTAQNQCSSGSYCNSYGSCHSGRGRGLGSSCNSSGSCSFPLQCLYSGGTNSFACL